MAISDVPAYLRMTTGLGMRPRRLRHDGQPATIRQVRLGGFVIA
ncbi:hypothetical protein DSM3645_03003 [Blastopirellula marina DSM 3645]|uniref:Uncharacterized protein n=1 Tax=Blastopirellula marina DSM 3645 TaxID=314230 RepID=A3ZVR4_9BACT|nr:hypothetical protein DSM3645_03003 [Blastopirellula marina DSM 3645]